MVDTTVGAPVTVVECTEAVARYGRDMIPLPVLLDARRCS